MFIGIFLRAVSAWPPLDLRSAAFACGLAAALTVFMAAAPPAHAAAVEPGTLLFEFGELGHDRGEFDGIRGIAVGPNGSIAVCSRTSSGYTSLVQVFNSNGTLVGRYGYAYCGSVIEFTPYGKLIVGQGYGGHSFGGYSLRAYDLDSFSLGLNWDIFGISSFDVGSDGTVAAAKISCHCVYTYHPNGSSHSRFGGLGRDIGEFVNPSILEIDSSGNVIISTVNSTYQREYQVYQPNGTFLGMLNMSYFDSRDRYADQRGPSGERVFSNNGNVTVIHSNGTMFSFGDGRIGYVAVGPTGLIVASYDARVRVYSGVGVTSEWDPSLLYAQVVPPVRDLPVYLPPDTVEVIHNRKSLSDCKAA